MLRNSILATVATLLAFEAHAGECRLWRLQPEPGYSLSGDVLHFPAGGTHQAGTAALRDAYGLVGPNRALLRTKFADTCGHPYQVGYRLEGNSLLMPNGGRHELPQADALEAERILRETYGLVGGRDALARTRW